MYNNSMDKQNETVEPLTTFSPNECIGWFVVLSIVGVATTTINVLTVIVYLLEQRLRKRTMYLVISLAVADMCVGGISLTIDVSMSGFSCGLWKIDPPPKGSAVARGGAGGARAPPVFFLKSKNRPV